MKRNVFYAIMAAVFFVFALTSLGGCGGSSGSLSGDNNSGNNNSPTQNVSELNGKTFASSAKNVYSGTAVDNDGNEFNVSLSRFIVGFSNVSTTTASEISTAAVTGSVAVSYIFEVETSVDRYAYNFKTVELINTSNDYKFSFNDVEVTVNPSSKNIIVDGAFYVDGKLYTLNEPFTLTVTEKSSDEEDESTDSEPRYILMGGEFADKNEYSGDLTPFINNRITERLYTYADNMDNVITTLESLKKGDFLFFSDAEDSFPNGISIADLFRLLSSLYDAYDEGVAFVTVHAISGDVEAMNEMLKLSLEYPDDNAPYQFFELLGVAKRPLSNGSSHVFTYTATCTGNQDYFDNSVSVSDDSYVQEGAEDISVDSNDISDTSEVDPEEFYKTLCEARVQALFDWEKGLDEQAAELDESVSASVTKFKTSAGLGDELMSIATGMTSYVDDHFSMSDYDYYGWSHQHSGEIKTLNMVRPLHTAVTAAAYDGNRDNKQYLGVFNAEDSWTAESNVDWIELAYADPSNPQVGRKVSGNSGGTGIRINYQAQENNTGRMRIGIITIKSGKDKVYIPFTQSGSGIN